MRAGEGGFGTRTEKCVALSGTFTAPRRDGEFHPAYARYIAVPSSNWLSNTCGAPSASNNKDAAIDGSAWGILGRASAATRMWNSSRRGGGGFSITMSEVVKEGRKSY